MTEEQKNESDLPMVTEQKPSAEAPESHESLEMPEVPEKAAPPEVTQTNDSATPQKRKKTFSPLNFLDRFEGLFTKAGVDYPVMRRILALKFLMDGRKAPSVAGSQSGAAGKSGNQFLKSLWVYGLMGIILIPLIIMGRNFMFQVSAAMGIVLFMVMTSLISDFSSVLLDLRDRSIVLTRPVEGRTLTAAKTIHVLGYLMMITGALTGPSIIAGFIRHGATFGFLYIWMIFWMDLLVIVLTAMLYLVVLRFFDGEKLRDIINYIQIALSIAMAVGYQFVGRMFQFVDLEITFQTAWWQFLLPPVWIGAIFEVLLNGSRDPVLMAMAVLAAGVPVLAVLLYARGMRTFERSLEKLEQRGSKGSTRLGLGHRLSGLICRNHEEALFFRFALNMIKTERDFKLRVYPSLGFSLIFPFIFILNSMQGSTWAEVTTGKSYLFIYFTAMMMPTILLMLKYSSSHKGAWIYAATPVRDLAAVYRGTLKAMMLRLLVPVFLLLSAVFLVIYGTRIALDLVVAFFGTMLFLMVCFRVLSKRLPFSEPFIAGRNAESGKMFPLTFGVGALGGLHYGATLVPYGTLGLLAASLLLNVYMWGPGFRRHLASKIERVDLTRYLAESQSGKSSPGHEESEDKSSADGHIKPAFKLGRSDRLKWRG
jgi:hypothetical protein